MLRAAGVQLRQPLAVGGPGHIASGTGSKQVLHPAAILGSQRIGPRRLGETPDNEEAVAGLQIFGQHPEGFFNGHGFGRWLGIEEVETEKEDCEQQGGDEEPG